MNDLKFIDNPAIKGREHNYVSVTVKVPDILESWRISLFSFEWISSDMAIKSLEELPEKEQGRRMEIEGRLRTGKPLEQPILGIGMLDNVEIGAGRAVFLTLAANGATEIPVHIPVVHEEDFKIFASTVE